jgi:phage shock protein E
MKPIILAAVLCVCAVPLTSHAGEPMSYDDVVAQARAGIDFVDNDHVSDRIAANADLLLYDVRTEAEYVLGRIPGAEWLPRGKAEFHVAKTIRDADAEIIIYCRSGSRAALVKKALDAQGYTNVSVHEGFNAWSKNGRAFETDFGLVQQVP